MLNKLINELCNPVVQFVLLLIAAKIFYVIGKECMALILFSVGLVWLFLVMSTPLSQYLIHRLENQYSPFEPSQISDNKPVYILVLSGGNAYRSSQDQTINVPSYTSARLVKGIEIHRQLQGSTLVSSGNSYTIALSLSLSNKEPLNLLELGADEFAICGEEQEDTKAEIEVFKRQVGTKGQLVMVTSAMHMPRAMVICKKMGISAIPGPTDYYVKIDEHVPQYDFYPSPEKMEMMQKALHEYLGMVQIYFLK